MKNSNKIIAWTEDGKERYVFDNVVEVIKKLNKSSTAIYNAINKGIPINGYFLDYEVSQLDL